MVYGYSTKHNLCSLQRPCLGQSRTEAAPRTHFTLIRSRRYSDLKLLNKNPRSGCCCISDDTKVLLKIIVFPCFCKRIICTPAMFCKCFYLQRCLLPCRLSPPGDVLMLPEGCPAPIEVKEKREEIVTPLYLVPEKVCPYNCGSTDTKANSRGAKVVAYTIHGPMPATSISGTCSRCGYNRFVDRATCTVDDGASKFTATIRHKDAAYFMATPETAFQVKLLRHAWCSVAHSLKPTFQGYCDTYNHLHAADAEKRQVLF